MVAAAAEAIVKDEFGRVFWLLELSESVEFHIERRPLDHYLPFTHSIQVAHKHTQTQVKPTTETCVLNAFEFVIHTHNLSL